MFLYYTIRQTRTTGRKPKPTGEKTIEEADPLPLRIVICDNGELPYYDYLKVMQ